MLGGRGGGSVDATAFSSAASTGYAITPEGAIGPYFVDDSAAGFNRSSPLTNIDGTSAQAGQDPTQDRLQPVVHPASERDAPA